MRDLPEVIPTFVKYSDGEVQVLISKAFLKLGIDDFQSITIIVIARDMAKEPDKEIAACFKTD